MGLYIKGLRVPKKGRYTSFTVYSDGRVVYKFGGDHAGQAIEVPAHGRLGDLDELEKSFREDADAEWNRFAAPVNWADAFDDVANMIAETPAIIPAEEET